MIAATVARVTVFVLAWLLGLVDFGALGICQAATQVDASTLTGKLIMGYQGWFACPGDPAGAGWIHWSAVSNNWIPTTDMLPDMTSLPTADRCPTPMRTSDGLTVDVFSSQVADVVDRHFAWMAEYGLDGVALQRFATAVLAPVSLAAVNNVLFNVRHAAEENGRVFFVMYDLTGMSAANLPAIAADWANIEAQGITSSPAYLHHRGRPLVGLWGLGFKGRPMQPADVLALLGALAKSGGGRGVTILGGVPRGWRTGTAGASSDPAWKSIWPMLGVISPWTVGAYVNPAGANSYKRDFLEPDMAAAKTIGADYMPVIFPGFSWANLQNARGNPSGAIFNQIPRQCGYFYWRQVFNAVGAGADMIYGAMFDEVDEGTAMFKLMASKSHAPVAGLPSGDNYVTLDSDGCALPSDWYLRLAGAATRTLHKTLDLSPKLPFAVP